MQLLNDLLPAFTSIVGVLVGAWLSYYFTRRQQRETIVAQSRQEWILKLQDLHSEFHANLQTISADFKMDGNLRSEEDGISDIIRVNSIRSQVKLMVNPNDINHTELVELMLEMANVATRKRTTKKFNELDNKFIEIAQKIIEQEWKRVRNGK